MSRDLQTRKTTTIQLFDSFNIRGFFWKKNNKKHQGGTTEGFPETPSTSEHEGYEEGLQLGPITPENGSISHSQCKFSSLALVHKDEIKFHKKIMKYIFFSSINNKNVSKISLHTISIWSQKHSHNFFKIWYKNIHSWSY